jgi:hypothetical protein
MGRKLKLTPDVQQRIIQAIALGAPYKQAAAYGGVVYSTFAEWMQKGEEGKKPYDELYAAVKQTEAVALVGWLAKIERAANEGTWQAAAWKAERRFPEDFGRQRLEVTGRDGEPLAGPQVLIYLPQKQAAPELPATPDDLAADTDLTG